jgi:hypothetical protein
MYGNGLRRDGQQQCKRDTYTYLNVASILSFKLNTQQSFAGNSSSANQGWWTMYRGAVYIL